MSQSCSRVQVCQRKGVTKRCCLSWLTNSVHIYEPKCEGWGGGGCGVSANENGCAHGAYINFGDIFLLEIFKGTSSRDGFGSDDMFSQFFSGIFVAVWARHGEIYFFLVPPSSCEVRRSSVGCSVAKKGAAQFRRVKLSSKVAAQLSRVQRSSVGRSVAQKGAAQIRGFSNALRVQRSLDRVQRSSVGCSAAQQDATQLSRLQRSSGGCRVAQEAASQLSRVQHCSLGRDKGYEILHQMQYYLGLKGSVCRW